MPSKVKGYTTELTRCAGANSIRLLMEDSATTSGNLAVLLRAQGCEGWMPGGAEPFFLQGSLPMPPIWGESNTMVIFRDFPCFLMHCLGWCHIMTPVLGVEDERF